MQIPQVTPLHIHLADFSSESITCSVCRQSPLYNVRRPSGSPRLSLNTFTKEPLEAIQTHLSKLEKLLQPLPSILSANNNNGHEEKETKLLERFDITKILPQMKKLEEMSPRNIMRSKRLVSISQEYSLGNILASRWREYHGCNHWDSLLDPLDDNLRHEVIKYGEFVQAAYHAFQSNASTASTSESAKPPLSPGKVAVPDKSYKVTKSLYATSSICPPSWINDMAPDLSWLTQRSSWIGYVAVCDDLGEIARMGRRDIVISLRGTSTCLEWVENFRNRLVKIPRQEQHDHSKVQRGFLSLSKTSGSVSMPSLSESILQEVRRLINVYKGETLSISITGHSLGAALALLVADELSTCNISIPPVAVYSFGGPRVGNRAFANRITNNGVKVLRVVNSQDVITRVPGMFVNETLGEKLLELIDDNVYSHVGRELRVDSKMSPNTNMACCHDLEAYLHLVDGFRASDCPFRVNAKRSLAKLLHRQGFDVKKFYTSKAHGLRLRWIVGKHVSQPHPDSK